MVTGACTADLSLILVDARKACMTQSRRHAIIASLLGIRHVVVVVNKMDLVDYSQAAFEQIRTAFKEFAHSFEFAQIDFIPVSALAGDMVVDRGENLDWYRGPTLLELLETTRAAESVTGEFRFPVQLVARNKFGTALQPKAEFRGYMGRIESGSVSVGDRIVVLPSGLEATIADIVTLDGSLTTATAPQSVTLLLDTQIDISRGDMIVLADGESVRTQPVVTSQISANLAWMSAEPLDISRRYLVKHTTQTVRAVIEHIDYRLDVNTLGRDAGVTRFKLNDIGRVRIKTLRPLIVDAYNTDGELNRATGSFIVIDEVSNQTVAAGMILDSGERFTTDKSSEATHG